jgi:hypothetical protein
VINARSKNLRERDSLSARSIHQYSFQPLLCANETICPRIKSSADSAGDPATDLSSRTRCVLEPRPCRPENRSEDKPPEAHQREQSTRSVPSCVLQPCGSRIGRRKGMVPTEAPSTWSWQSNLKSCVPQSPASRTGYVQQFPIALFTPV